MFGGQLLHEAYFATFILAPLAVTATTVWFTVPKPRAIAHRRAMLLSALAAAPGVGVAVDFGLAFIGQPPQPNAFQFPSVVIGMLWLFVAPLLFLAAGFLRRRDSPSVTDVIVHGSHGCLWLVTTYVATIAAATV